MTTRWQVEGIRVLALSLALLSTKIATGIDVDVCNPDAIVSGGNKAMPTIATSYQLGMLVINEESKDSSEVLLGSDGLKAYAKTSFASQQTTLLGDYKRDQMLELTATPALPGFVKCRVSNLAEAAAKGQWLLGYNKTVDPHPLDPGWVLQFNEFRETFTDTVNVAGIPCLRWQACADVKMRGQPAQTVGIKFYWSDPDQWTSVAGLDKNNKPYSVPVLIEMTQKMIDKVVTQQLFIFRYLVMGPPKEAFDIPQGVFCHRLSSEGVKLPPMPHYFSYDSEIVIRDEFKNLILYQKQYYDHQLNLTRLEFSSVLDGQKLPDDGDQPNLAGEMTLIHDSRAGLSYWLSKKEGTCVVTPVSETQEDVEVERMINPLTFLQRTDFNYTYYEEKKERGMTGSLFMGIQIDDPEETATIYEFWFSAPFQEIEGEDIWTSNKPIKFSTYPFLDPLGKSSLQINLFNFDVDRPNVLEYDITSCTPLDQRQEVQFSLEGRYDASDLPNVLDFKHQILIALVEVTLVPPLRIHNIQLGIANDATTIRFTLLAPAPVKGNHTDDYKDTPSDQAVEKLRSAIDGGHFLVGLGGHNLDLQAVKGSLSLVTPEASEKHSAGHSDGAMAGVGIGTTLLGLLLGGGAAYLVVLKKTK